jgi:hypothetical protein
MSPATGQQGIDHGAAFAGFGCPKNKKFFFYAELSIKKLSSVVSYGQMAFGPV